MKTGYNLMVDSLYAPPVAYWVALAGAGRVQLETSSWYRKGSYRNRCHIYGANGLLRLSVPVMKGSGTRSRMQDVRISYDHPWQQLHWESICIAYRSSPYFEYYEEELAPVFQRQTTFLLDLNQDFMEVLSGLVGIPWEPHLSASYATDHGTDWMDLREDFRPSVQGCGRMKISFEPYHQVFGPKHGFLPDLSVLDLIFHQGPGARDYLSGISPVITND